MMDGDGLIMMLLIFIRTMRGTALRDHYLIMRWMHSELGWSCLKKTSQKIFFGGKNASSVRRPKPVRMTLTAAAEFERREKQLTATTSSYIEKASYTKFEMSHDIEAYVAFTPRSDAVAAVINGAQKQLFIPRTSVSRPQLAAALSRWRSLDRVHCTMAHESSAGVPRHIFLQPKNYKVSSKRTLMME